jgi:pimeloyl-ACP methyl ester carboxylesterase
MKVDFSKMDVASVPFQVVRAMMVAGTGGAEVSECLLAIGRIKENDQESWVREWAAIAENVARAGEQALYSGQPGGTIAARQAFMRASNYYRTAMFPLPPADDRLDRYITLSRDCFHRAAGLFSPAIEIVEIPFRDARVGDVRLPGYFLAAGGAGRPTLIALNGADSTNEELAHWIGFAAVARGWNCLVFEGPGQWSALQLNPGLYLRHDYELPVKAVVDYLLQRDEVDRDNIALIGYSLGSLLAARAVAFEKRISACIVNDLIVDVSEAWEAVWPPALQKAFRGVFDVAVSAMERRSPELRGFVNHHKFAFGVSRPSEILEKYRPFNIQGLSPRIQCPMLLLYGEAGYKETSAKVALSTLRFISKLTCPVAIHEFGLKDGWAASHCQMGALSLAQPVILDWLDRTVKKNELALRTDSQPSWHLVNKYHPGSEMEKIERSIQAKVGVSVV